MINHLDYFFFLSFFCKAYSHGFLVGCTSLLNLYLAMGGSQQLTVNAMQGAGWV